MVEQLIYLRICLYKGDSERGKNSLKVILIDV